MSCVRPSVPLSLCNMHAAVDETQFQTQTGVMHLAIQVWYVYCELRTIEIGIKSWENNYKFNFQIHLFFIDKIKKMHGNFEKYLKIFLSLNLVYYPQTKSPGKILYISFLFSFLQHTFLTNRVGVFRCFQNFENPRNVCQFF